MCQKKQLVKKKRANLNQSKCGKKKKYTLKEIAKIYPLFNPTQAGGGGGAKVSAPNSSFGLIGTGWLGSMSVFNLHRS